MVYYSKRYKWNLFHFKHLGVAGIGAETNPTFVKRFPDNRSLDEKIYKFRVVIPKELPNAKTPESGFIIQESSTTGVRDSADFSLSSIDHNDYEYNKNPRFISTCSHIGQYIFNCNYRTST